MPTAQLKNVYAASSEDTVHLAANLLGSHVGKKWKCKVAGESSIFVVLQLDQPHCITGIDIGNEHSAFATVSVGNLPYKDAEFQEILITSSFMTPIESKNSANTNRVRCFAGNALVESVAKEKWELIKVACSQPFNRHVQYGLSFVTVHVASAANEASRTKVLVPDGYLAPKKADAPSTGALVLRGDSPDSDSEAGSSLFNRWKHLRRHPTSAAAAIRAASNPSTLKNTNEALKPSKVHLAASSSPRVEKDPKNIRDRNRDDLLHDKDDDIRNERLEKKISEDQSRLQKEKDAMSAKKDESMHKTESKEDVGSRKQKRSPRRDERKLGPDDKTSTVASSVIAAVNYPETRRKRPSSPINTSDSSLKKLKPYKAVEYKPFNELLRGVVLVISGIQNPDRGILRQRAIELGARYKADWDDGCTHLICAFKNTPKYNQVKNKGKIVTRQWIEKCHCLKKRLPWRRFALDDREADKLESEDEVWDVSLKPLDGETTDSDSSGLPAPEEQLESAKPEEKSASKPASDEILAQYDKESSRNYLVSSGSDTDEDIQKLTTKKETPLTESHDTYKDATLTKNTLQLPPKSKEKKRKLIVFEASTDEDETIKGAIGEGHKFPELFDGLNFYLSPNLMATELLKIKQYIKQFRGQFVADLYEANYLISKEKVETAEGFKGEVVSPLWIFECHDMECIIPTRRYVL